MGWRVTKKGECGVWRGNRRARLPLFAVQSNTWREALLPHPQGGGAVEVNRTLSRGFDDTRAALIVDPAQPDHLLSQRNRKR